MIKRKSGFMMIETIVTINILLLLIAIFLSSNSIEKNIKYQIDSKYASSEIHNILTYAKCWCKKNDSTGEIDIDTDNNYIYFRKDRNKIIKKVKIPESTKMFCSESNKTIKIASNGKIKNATKISIYDKLNNTLKVTIRVGIDKITVY